MKTYRHIFITILSFAACNSSKEIKPERKDITDAVFASGSVENINEYLVTASLEGYLNSSIVSEGDTVKPGQVLFKLANDIQQAQVQNARINYKYAKEKESPNSPQIQQLQIQIDQAIEQGKIDSLNFLRFERLVKTNAVSKIDYEKSKLQFETSVSNVHALQKSLADLKNVLSLNSANASTQLIIQSKNNQFYTLASSINAIVLNVYKKNGDLVKKGETLAKLTAGPKIAKLLIAEEDIQRIKTGMATIISLNTQKDNFYKAKISKVYPGFDKQIQSFIVEATFDDLPKNVFASTQLQANIIIEEKRKALVIPVQYLENRDRVTLKKGKKKIPVKVGIRNLKWIEIISGLTENDEIIIEYK